MSSKILRPDALVEKMTWQGFIPEPDKADTPEPPPPKLEPAATQNSTQLEDQIRTLQARIEDEKRAAFAQGQTKGAEEEAAKWKQAIARVGDSIASLARHKQTLRAEVEEDAVRLSLAIARKVLYRELTVDPPAIAGLVH